MGYTGSTKLTDVQLGQGRLIWCPLPIELNERIEPLEELYKLALAAAGAAEELEWQQGGDCPGLYGRKLSFRDGALYIFVSEYAIDTDIRIKDPVTGVGYAFVVESERTVMFAADLQGEITAVYRPEEVAIMSL